MFEEAASSRRTYGRRGFLSLAMAGGVAMTASGCGLLGGSDDSGSTNGGSGLEKAKIKVSIMPTIDLAPFHLAVQNGYFKNEGLEVETVDAASGDASLTKLIGGEVDIAYASYTPFFIAKSKNIGDIKLVADCSSAGPKSTEIVAMPGGAVKNVHDLEHKKIAITATNTICDTLTKSVMRDNGADFSTVTWVSMKFPDIGSAVKRGDVDAGFLTEPFITQSAKVNGTVEVIDTASGGTKDFPTAGFGSLGKFTDANPKTVAAFQRAMVKATKDAADRSKIEPLMVQYSKVDAATAKLTTLLTFQSTLDARRIQRVPDLLQQFNSIPSKIDVASMIVPQVSAS